MCTHGRAKAATALCTALLCASGAAAQTLSIVEAGAPDVNCVFAADCKLQVNDTVGTFELTAASGKGRLQSRGAQRGETGRPGAGLFPFEYRIDLTQMRGVTARSCVREMRIPVGPTARLDYNGDGRPDDIYVITRGGLGSVGPSAARREGGDVVVEFKTPVCPGETSYFFGMASARPLVDVVAKLRETLASDVLQVEARAPQGRGAAVAGICDVKGKKTGAEKYRGRNFRIRGCVYAAVQRPEGSPEEPSPVLAGVAPERVLGGKNLTALHLTGMVRVNVLDAATKKSLLKKPALVTAGDFELDFPARGGRQNLIFEITAADTGELLFHTEPVKITRGIRNVFHILVPDWFVLIRPGWLDDLVFPFKTGVFTRIGNVDLDEIDAKGFAKFATLAPQWRDAPFGHVLSMFGAFSSDVYPQGGTNTHCYKIKVTAPGGGSFYLNEPLKKKRFTVLANGTVVSVEVPLGPFTLGGVNNCYRLTPMSSGNTFWSKPDLLMTWDTRLRNGFHKAKLELYKISSGNQVPLLVNDNLEAELYLDNTPVTASFDVLKLVKANGSITDMLTDKCAIIDLTANATLEVDFSAYHPTGFLSYYRLTAKANSGALAWDSAGFYAAAPWVGPKPPAFNGRVPGAPSFTKQAGDFSAGSCAYELEIWAWARTTNGFHRWLTFVPGVSPQRSWDHKELFYYVLVP